MQKQSTLLLIVSIFLPAILFSSSSTAPQLNTQNYQAYRNLHYKPHTPIHGGSNYYSQAYLPSIEKKSINPVRLNSRNKR